MLTHNLSSADTANSFRERLLDLAWSLWAELGVPGWTRRHQTWAIDPEPLILFTALIGDNDPRLRDEAISWCVRNARYIAGTRLRNLLKRASPELRERWGQFAATANALGNLAWPGATNPLPVRPSTKEAVDDFGRAALISLRLRSTFGLGARSELLLYFASRPNARATASDLSDAVHYSKRNVEKELEALRKAGMLAAERRRNRLEHFVDQPDRLLILAAPRPEYFPRWDLIFSVLSSALEFEEQAKAMDAAVVAVEARRLLRAVKDLARQCGLPPPPAASGSRPPTTPMLDWAGSVIDALARADASALGWAAVEPLPTGDRRAAGPHGVRSIASPLLATATDLAVWADTREAQERTPEVLRRLILATLQDLERIDMGGGEAVQYGGYDGVVFAGSGTPFVPAGLSVWEVGVSSDVKRKATDDLAKRTASPLGVDPSDATFVFVTPRRWSSKRLWERDQAGNGSWKAIRVLDADDLEAWLGLAPAVHLWLSALLGKSWESVQDLRSFWSDWSQATEPATSPEVVIAGRTQSEDELRKRIEQPSALARVQGESADEALAFIAATIQGMDDAEALLARSLVISDIAGWNWATSSTKSAILIPRFADPNTVNALRQGHRVIVPVGREEASPDDLVLPRLRRDAVRSALLKAGVPEGRADDLAAHGRASLTSLRRRLAVDKGMQRPAWAHRVQAPTLLPALLAGAWDDAKPGDQEVLSAWADLPYQDVERNMVRWAKASDPPVRKVGTNWFLVSKEDAWNLLSPFLTPHDIARFRESLLRALGASDPALDLPPEDRFMASVLGHEHPLSTYLREGLVDTLAIMGARSQSDPLLTGRPGQWHASDITRDLLDRANADASGKLWASLSRVLPLLAEAAPDVFLQAIEEGLSRDPSSLLSLFADADGSASFFASSPHTGLLWALENLAWSAEYLGLAAHHLATLSRLDPGGKQGDRPNRSLRAIFLTWDPQTSAPLSTRIAVLDSLMRSDPDVAWQLLTSILPALHDVSMPTHTPRWRDWKDPHDARVPFEDYERAVQAVIDRVLAEVGVNGKRWSDVLRAVGELPWERVVAALERRSPEDFREEDRALVWAALRSEISRHRSFSDSEWALPEAAVNRLADLYERFAPADLGRRHAWLFSARPDLPEGERREWTKFVQIVREAQADAVKSLREHGGLPALLRLAGLADDPQQVGRVVGLTATPDMRGEETAVLELIGASDPIASALARGYVAGRFECNSWPWVDGVLERDANDWGPGKSASFLFGLPFARATWDRAHQLGQETERAYWSGASAYWVDDPAGIEQAAERLVEHGRAHAAVDLLAMLVQAEKRPVDAEAVATALERLLAQGSPDHMRGLGQDISALLDFLEKSGAIEESLLAQLEWRYLGVLSHRQRQAPVLHRELARNPTFFFDVLCMVFRAHGEEPQELSSGERTNAALGYRLLDSWRSPPGYRDDSTVDERQLNDWVDTARNLAAQHGRSEVADQMIGQVLRYLPEDPNGLWPNRAVRDLLERVKSQHLETGLQVGLQNSRGVTWRSATEGGTQERGLQGRYVALAQQVIAEWPRTAAMLRRIARSYAEEARRHDEEAEITEDRWR